MLNKTINLYNFEELDKKVQEKVIETFREQNTFDFLEEDLRMLLDEKLEKEKIKVISNLELYYSLGYSQGDGACFIGFFDWKKYHIKITHSGNDYHHNSKNIYMYYYDENREDISEDEEIEADEKTYNEFEEIYCSICDYIEKSGYRIMEDENSEEAIIETIKSNEYTFRENGEMENA